VQPKEEEKKGKKKPGTARFSVASGRALLLTPAYPTGNLGSILAIATPLIWKDFIRALD
jgi:hypothetical protein